MAIPAFVPRPRWRWLHWLWRIPLLWLACVILMLLVWRVIPVQTSSFMFQQQVAHYFNEDYPPVRQQWVDFADISPNMALAVIAAEDQLFPKHHGIDIASTRAAINAALNGKANGGGSTITQQVAKNLFLWSDKSYLRKGLEWLLALLIELVWDKQRILEVYLNIAQFSEQHYGVGVAAPNLLKKEPGRLTKGEAAALAAVLPAPHVYLVQKPSRTVKRRQRHILRQMRQLGGARFLKDIVRD